MLRKPDACPLTVHTDNTMVDGVELETDRCTSHMTSDVVKHQERQTSLNGSDHIQSHKVHVIDEVTSHSSLWRLGLIMLSK